MGWACKPQRSFQYLQVQLWYKFVTFISALFMLDNLRKKNEHNLAPCKNYLFVKCYQGFKISFIFFFCLLGEQVCTKNIYGVRAVVACLPAWFRFAQCLRRYRDTKLVFPHVVNAGKYSTTFFVQLFAALYKVHVGL